MKIKTRFVCFYKCSFVLRVCAVIFELDKISISNFGKFEFWSMTLKIERVLEKTNKILSKKNGQKGQEFSKEKGPQPMQKFLHEEKIHFFV